MASQLKMLTAYTKWKSNGLKRSLNDSLAAEFGVNRSTLYNWSKKPITINGVTYKTWEDAYAAETKEIRENYELEINNKLAEGYKLLDVIADEVMMKYLLKVKDEKYKPTLDELVKINELIEKRNERINGTNNGASKGAVDNMVKFTLDVVGSSSI